MNEFEEAYFNRKFEQHLQDEYDKYCEEQWEEYCKEKEAAESLDNSETKGGSKWQTSLSHGKHRSTLKLKSN